MGNYYEWNNSKEERFPLWTLKDSSMFECIIVSKSIQEQIPDWKYYKMVHLYLGHIHIDRDQNNFMTKLLLVKVVTPVAYEYTKKQHLILTAFPHKVRSR